MLIILHTYFFWEILYRLNQKNQFFIFILGKCLKNNLEMLCFIYFGLLIRNTGYAYAEDTVFGFCIISFLMIFSFCHFLFLFSIGAFINYALRVTISFVFL